MKTLCRLSLILLIPIAIVSCQNQENSGAENEIRKRSKDYINAFNKGDTDALTKFWDEKGVLVDPQTGETIKGREALRERYNEMFEDSKNATLDLKIDSISFTKNGQAVEQGTAVISRPGEPQEKTSFKVIYEKKNGQWLITNVSENSVQTTQVEENEHLKDLSWLIGDWVDEDADSKLEQSFSWDPYKNFIIHKFIISVHDRINAEGEQVIGWDPDKQQVRSWIFDSSGGFGQGKWKKNGDEWIIESAYTLPDGGKGSSINKYKKLSGDTFSWESSNREIDGDILPNIDPIKVRKKA